MTCLCVTLCLTFEVRSPARHEEFNSLNLGQVTMFMLLLYVAVGPASKRATLSDHRPQDPW